jgi:hypothetical protein
MTGRSAGLFPFKIRQPVSFPLDRCRDRGGRGLRSKRRGSVEVGGYGRVRNGRGSFGPLAITRFPSLLIESDVRSYRIRPRWTTRPKSCAMTPWAWARARPAGIRFAQTALARANARFFKASKGVEHDPEMVISLEFWAP